MVELSHEPEWLIRDNTNVIRGPYFAREVLQLLKKGQLKGKNELCKANSYWFYVEERSELEKFFPDITITDTRKIQTGTHGVGVTKTLLDGGRQEFTAPVPAVDPADLPLERARPLPDPLGSAARASAPARGGAFYGIDQEEPTAEIEAPRGKKNFLLILAGAFVLALAVAFVTRSPAPRPAHVPARTAAKPGVKDPWEGLSLDKRVLNAFLANDPEQAERAFELVEEKRKGSAEGHLIRAMIKRRFQFDVDGALASLDQARSASKSPKMGAFLDLLRGVYLMQKDPAAAVRVFSSVSEESMRVTARWNLAVALLTVQSLDEASRAIDAVEKLGDAPGADFLRAWLGDMRAPGDAAAETHLLKALAGGVDAAKVRLLMGLHKLRRGQLSAAEENFRLFVDLLPELDAEVVAGEPHRLRADAVYSWAAHQISEVHGLSSSDIRKPSAVVMATLAMLTGIEGRLQDASGILDSAARIGGGGAVVSKVMAYLKWKSSSHQEAIDLLFALGDGSRDAVMNYLFGRALLRSGKPADALRPLESASLKLSSRADVHGHLAEALAASQRDADAKAAAEKALRLDPFEYSAISVLSRLGEHAFLDREEYRAILPFGEI
ncbi:MAG: hypothetical protein HUU37_03810 [Bdellovibrionales bacterium]|nr:hypothetical protein [Bdellovibrionales bacterium]